MSPRPVRPRVGLIPFPFEALAAMERDRGDRAKAIVYAEKLAALAPDDSEAQALVRELRR